MPNESKHNFIVTILIVRKSVQLHPYDIKDLMTVTMTTCLHSKLFQKCDKDKIQKIGSVGKCPSSSSSSSSLFV